MHIQSRVATNQKHPPARTFLIPVYRAIIVTVVVGHFIERVEGAYTCSMIVSSQLQFRERYISPKDGKEKMNWREEYAEQDMDEPAVLVACREVPRARRAKMVMPAPRSSASKSSVTPEASSMEAATLNPRASVRTRVMLTAGDQRLLETVAAMSKPEGTMRPPTTSTLMLHGSLVMAPTTVAFDHGEGAVERTTTTGLPQLPATMRSTAPILRIRRPASRAHSPAWMGDQARSGAEVLALRCRREWGSGGQRSWQPVPCVDGAALCGGCSGAVVEA